jgi:hypothetical protein
MINNAIQVNLPGNKTIRKGEYMKEKVVVIYGVAYMLPKDSSLEDLRYAFLKQFKGESPNFVLLFDEKGDRYISKDASLYSLEDYIRIYLPDNFKRYLTDTLLDLPSIEIIKLA